MDSLYFGPFRVSQWLAGLSCIAAVSLLLYLSFKTHDPQKLLVNQLKKEQEQKEEEKPQEESENPEEPAEEQPEQEPEEKPVEEQEEAEAKQEEQE